MSKEKSTLPAIGRWNAERQITGSTNDIKYRYISMTGIFPDLVEFDLIMWKV